MKPLDELKNISFNYGFQSYEKLILAPILDKEFIDNFFYPTLQSGQGKDLGITLLKSYREGWLSAIAISESSKKNNKT